MLTANAPDGERVEPTPGLIGECPVCCETVHAKCGQIVVPHFAHEPTGEERDCDDWSEQSLFPYRWREVVIGPHRADYGPHMLWIFDAKDPVDAGRHSFRWKHPRKTQDAVKHPPAYD